MSEEMININGNIVSSKRSGLSVNNRAYKYGDGLFESIRIAGGRPLFLEDHYSRLQKGMTVLGYEPSSAWDQSYFRKEIVKLIETNEIARGGRIRLSVFRQGEGLYIPKSNEVGYVIEAWKGESDEFLLNESGLTLGLFEDVRIHPSILSPLKTNNALPYILAGISARKDGFEDVILLNDKGNLCEGISSNVFIKVDGMLYTPALNDGCTAGVMRKKIIQLSKKMNTAVIESSISPDLLNGASEVFLTNAISGIIWVKAYQKSRYMHKTADQLLPALNALI